MEEETRDIVVLKEKFKQLDKALANHSNQIKELEDKRNNDAQMLALLQQMVTNNLEQNKKQDKRHEELLDKINESTNKTIQLEHNVSKMEEWVEGIKKTVENIVNDSNFNIIHYFKKLIPYLIIGGITYYVTRMFL